MIFFLISILAGVLTVFTPCVLPLLPVIVGGSLVGGSNKRSYTIIFSLIFTIVLFTFLIKFLTIFINIPQIFWSYFSGVLLIILSFSILFSNIWYKIPALGKISVLSNKSLGVGYMKNNFWGDVIIGLSLGPVFSTCSPTYFVILATVLPSSFLIGSIYLFAFASGLGLALLLISIFGQKIVNKFEILSNPDSKFKKIIGILFLLVALLIMSGVDKKIETFFINKLGDNNPVNFEKILIKNFDYENKINNPSSFVNGNQIQTSLNVKEYKGKIFGRYQEFVNPSGFLNTQNGVPIKMSDYIGKKIILIDFMTYSCINCQRTFPYLNDWYSKYESKGLLIIGIHTPEFAFEKNKENIQTALDGFGIKFPIVMDNNYGTWNAYQNDSWPRKYIIDLNGDIVYDHIGEGEYQDTENKIIELLNTLPENNNLKSGIATTTFNPDFSKITSSETYLGYDRLDHNAVDISKSCFDNSCNFSFLDKKIFPKDSFCFDGNWIINSQYAIGKVGSSLYYNFSASKVHLVMNSPKSAKVKITLDGDKNTTKIININDAKLYTIVDLNGKYENHIIKMEIISGNVQAYTFTFS